MLQHSDFHKLIYTPPRKLIQGDPALCIDQNNNTNCEIIYFVKNIILGQEIIIDACVFDYYDQPADGTEFFVIGEDQDHRFDGSRSILIFCDTFNGISIVGKEISQPANFSISISSHEGRSLN